MTHFYQTHSNPPDCSRLKQNQLNKNHLKRSKQRPSALAAAPRPLNMSAVHTAFLMGFNRSQHLNTSNDKNYRCTSPDYLHNISAAKLSPDDCYHTKTEWTPSC